jgi:transposase
MANQIISMNKLRKYLKLSLDGCSLRQISTLIGISRTTLNKYKELLDKFPLSNKELLKLSDKELYSIVYPPSEDKISHEKLHAFFPEMERQLTRIGVTRFMLWEQYKIENPDCIQYSQFCEHFRNYQESQKISYVFEHKAADKVMFDYAGKKLHLIDPETGEQIAVEFFVAILPCSQYTYAEASLSQKTPDFLGSIARSLTYFGGVPNALVTDNLTPAVNKASKYDPEINRSMADFAEHYDTVVLPTRARKPKDKALVESAVNILYSRIYAPLHDKVYHTLTDLNKAILALLGKHNAMLFQGKSTSRRQQFESMEKELLKPLPHVPFELKSYQEAKVHPNCHVLLSEDKHHYSVPYQYVGLKVQIGFTSQSVEIYHKYERIAIHQRSRNNHRYTTNSAHLHPKHQYYNNWSEDFFLSEGIKVGLNTQQFITQIFHQSKHPEQGYKSCQGVLMLAKKHGNDKVEIAARICLQYEFVSYTKLAHILSLDYLKITETEQEDEIQLNLYHENIRGESNYK